MAGKQGSYDEIDVAGRPRRDARRELKTRDRARRCAAHGRRAHRQGAGRPAGQRPPGRSSRFLQTGLLVFAGIALFVGAFIIFNTFSITVAQRTREFALLRTLGASRRQILRSVLARGARDRRRRGRARPARRASLSRRRCSALFKAFGADLPDTGTVHRVAHDHRLAARRHDRDASSRASRPRCAPPASPPLAAMREGVVRRSAAAARARTSSPSLLARARRRARCSSGCSAAASSGSAAGAHGPRRGR